MSVVDDKLAEPAVSSRSTGSDSIAPASPARRLWWKWGGEDISFAPVDQGSSTTSDTKRDDLETGTTGLVNVKGSVFDDSSAAQFYEPPEKYEGRHRFDPKATWTPDEERRLVRALDWRICLPACIFFFALQLDKGNISQALSDNMLDDLHLNTDDYNNGMTIFYCSYLVAELPSQLISKRIGPDNWIPIQMVLWSIVAITQCRLTDRTSFFITRFLLGVLEGGFIPDVILYLSYFYTNKELPTRLAWFWTSFITTNIVSSFIAYGVFHLEGHPGLMGQGWRYLFAIEGGLTAFIGIVAWFYLPPSPTHTKGEGIKGFFRGKNGWFSEREETIMVTRILRDDPGKSSMHNREAITLKLLWTSFCDYDMWPIYLIGLTWTIPMTPPTSYLTLSLKALGFSTLNTNLLVIPSSVLFILQLQFWTWVSEKTNQRMFVGLVSQIWVIPLLIAFETLPGTFPHSNWIKYAISTLIVGYPYAHAVMAALASRNAGTVRTRTVGTSMYNMTIQASNIISSQIYRAKDKPYYYTGNKVLLGVAAFNVLLFVGTKIFYVQKNNKRDETWNGMTRDEKLNYLATTEDKGNKRLDFRFAS